MFKHKQGILTMEEEHDNGHYNNDSITALVMSTRFPYREYKQKKWLTTMSSFFSWVADAANKMQGGKWGKSKKRNQYRRTLTIYCIYENMLHSIQYRAF